MNQQTARRMQAITPFYVMDLLKRAKELEKSGWEIIHMEIGEPDFPTTDAVIQSGIKYLQTGQVKYTPAAGLTELREAIANFYQRQYAVNVSRDRIFITPGASGAFLLAFAATLNPGEQVLLTDPGYPCNRNFLELFDVSSCLVPVTEESGFQLNQELVERHWQSRTRGAVIASPANPTGTLIADDELEKIIHYVDQKAGFLFSDEIYHGLVYGEAACSALQFTDRAFVINSFSKYFGMTGWRVGWMVVPEAFCPAVEKLAQNVFISTSAHSQYAALASFSPENLVELEKRRSEFGRRRDYLYQALQRLGFNCSVKPEGAFYIYADCRQFTDESFTFASALLESEGVAVTPGRDFGKNQPEHYVRFAYTTDLQSLHTGIERIERFIKNL